MKTMKTQWCAKGCRHTLVVEFCISGFDHWLQAEWNAVLEICRHVEAASLYVNHEVSAQVIEGEIGVIIEQAAGETYRPAG